ncbi:SPOR domain-containing protein [Gilvimarinus sp. F26214L]|uniref:SPOR domain-containing protein n=1 Tax=Gilvimarinus sp. DZF01 TaxID=3461371 RepID=UPI004045E623
MTRDYAKKKPRPQARPRPRTQVPAWVWLFTGSVLGAFVMFLIYLAGIPPQPGTLDERLSEAVQTIEPQEPAEPQEDDAPKPRFDFYQLLKESEVVVKPDPLPRKEVAARKENIEYVLQVGSFKNPEDADRLRAQLILLNLDATVETVKVRNAETWHRVLVGPFDTHANMSRARGTLANNELSSLLLQRKADG